VTSKIKEEENGAIHQRNVYQKKIFVPEETHKICAHFGVDPLQLISSGSLLVVTEEENAGKIISSLSTVAFKLR